MKDDNSTVTVRISRVCMDFVKNFASKNDVSNSEQINTIVKTYEHFSPSNIVMDGFINERYKQKNKIEERFTYETLYILYRYAIKKNNKYKDYYHFSAILSKWMITTYYIETHMEIYEEYDGGPNAKNSRETARFLLGEKFEDFIKIAKNIIQQAQKVEYDDNIYGERLTDYIYMLCLSNKKLEILFLDDCVKTREKMLFDLTEKLKDNFSKELSSQPYISFQDFFGVKHIISKILIDYYQAPKSFIIPSYVSESFICDLLDNLHRIIYAQRRDPYSKSITAALKIGLEVAKLEMYESSYHNYFANKLESKEKNLLNALQEDINTFQKDEIVNNVTAEFVTRVPLQVCQQTLSAGCNFLEFSKARQSVNQNFLDIFWPTLKYIIEKDSLPLLLNPNKVIEYGGDKNFINEYGLFKGSYITSDNNPFTIYAYENNFKQLRCSIKYKKDDYSFNCELDIETINKLEVLMRLQKEYLNTVFTSKLGVTVEIEAKGSIYFRGKNFNISINKNISNKFYEVIKKFKHSKDYENILIANRLHHGEL
ncbi:hypothetical protein [Sulfurimonas sp.]|uniref:hypothetical protein n=1 Tax=Sulfurimonas sp. TaxID=2022749 RepID=UPI0025E300AA|nr:hypothetical protein [Sulfurimonas sp.]